MSMPISHLHMTSGETLTGAKTERFRDTAGGCLALACNARGVKPITATMPQGSGVTRGYYRRRSAWGFTLIELMIGLLLGVLTLLVAIGIFEANQRVIQEKQRLDLAQDTMRYTSTLLGRLIRNAEFVLPGSSSTSLRLLTVGGAGIVDCFGTPRTGGRFAMDITIDSEATSDPDRPVFVMFCAIDDDVPEGETPSFGPPQLLARWIPDTSFLYAAAPTSSGEGEWSAVGEFFSTPSGVAEDTHAVRVEMVAPSDKTLLMTSTLRARVVALETVASQDD